MNYILASASPRRKELLEQIGLTFEIIPATGEENCTFTKPEEVVTELSRQKAFEIAEKRKDKEETEVIIGADTVVSFEGEILGKPKDEQDAYRMISMLQNQVHTVYTGVTLIEKKKDEIKSRSFYEETKVVMYPISETERRRYVATKEPMDKAGGYGIQGKCAVFIKEIRGDYNNVVGLPIAKIYQELRQMSIDIYSELHYDKNEP